MVQLATICYIDNGREFLMLHRNKKPNDVHAGKWIGVGGKLERGETPQECAAREILEETGLTITHPKLVGVKNWHTDEGIRYIVFCYKATEFSGQIHSTEEGEISWVDKNALPKLDLAYDMLELLRMMEDEELSEYYYHERIEAGWRKSMY